MKYLKRFETIDFGIHPTGKKVYLVEWIKDFDDNVEAELYQDKKGDYYLESTGIFFKLKKIDDITLEMDNGAVYTFDVEAYNKRKKEKQFDL